MSYYIFKSMVSVRPIPHKPLINMDINPLVEVNDFDAR